MADGLSNLGFDDSEVDHEEIQKIALALSSASSPPILPITPSTPSIQQNGQVAQPAIQGSSLSSVIPSRMPGNPLVSFPSSGISGTTAAMPAPQAPRPIVQGPPQLPAPVSSSAHSPQMGAASSASLAKRPAGPPYSLATAQLAKRPRTDGYPVSLPPPQNQASAVRPAGTYPSSPAPSLFPGVPSPAFPTPGPLSTKPIAEKEESVEDLQDVTKTAGVNLQEESQLMLSTTTDSHTELPGHDLAQDRAAYLVDLAFIKLKARQSAYKAGLLHIREDVFDALATSVQERLRSVIEDLIVISKHRTETIKGELQHKAVTNPKKQLWLLERREKELARLKEEKQEQADLTATKSRRPDKQTKEKLQKSKESKEMKIKAAATSAAVMAATGLATKSWMTASPAAPGAPAPAPAPSPSVESSRPAKPSPKPASSLATPSTPKTPLTRLPAQKTPQRHLTLQDALYWLERERELRKSAYLYKVYMRLK